jgi:hypothetical protein
LIQFEKFPFDSFTLIDVVVVRVTLLIVNVYIFGTSLDA